MVLSRLNLAEKRMFWPYWFASIEVSMLSFSIGLMAGWTSPYLAKLTAEDSKIPITKKEASWVASLMHLGRLVGAVIGALAVEYIGSKSTLQITGIPLILGWICIAIANSAAWLYVARILSGAGMGMIFSSFPMYIGEISKPSIRGGLVSLIITGMPFGTLIGNIMGPYISMWIFACISLVPNCMFFILFLFIPNSPHFLVRKKNYDKALKSISWYHRGSNAEQEMESIKKFQEGIYSSKFIDKVKEMGEPINRKAFIMVIVLFLFMQLSGLNSIVFYMEIIVKNAKVTAIEPSTVVIISNTVGIVIGWIAIYAIDKCGRRILLLISSSGVIVAMFMLGLHFMLIESGYDSKKLQWLPILSLILFMLMCLGLVPVPSTILSELFPANLKSIAGFVGSLSSAVFAFLSSKTYQPLVDLVAEQYVFWIYGIIICGALVFGIWIMPETKGKTLQEVRDMLAGREVARDAVKDEESEPPEKRTEET